MVVTHKGQPATVLGMSLWWTQMAWPQSRQTGRLRMAEPVGGRVALTRVMWD